jgi:NADH-quinone oxidoreductase subunit J
VDVPALLPDGTAADLSVSATLRDRGQVRDVSRDAMRRLAALDQASGEWLERKGLGPVRSDDPAADPARTGSTRAADRSEEGAK